MPERDPTQDVLPEHIPIRNAWLCTRCLIDWPCVPARRKLLDGEMDGTTLRIYMWLQLEQAAMEMPDAPAGELFERFLHWTSPRIQVDPTR